MKSKTIAIMALSGLLIGAGTSSARNDTCVDGHGNPHYCFHPDAEPDLTMYTVEATAVVAPHKIGTAEAYCDSEESDTYAVGGGESTNPVQAGVKIPQRAYVTENAPIFEAPDSAPTGWVASVVNGSVHPVTLRVFVNCLK